MALRDTMLDRLDGGDFDVFVVGGGINGAVAAAALAGRGASVGLVDRGDFAGFTSQESSNLVWGGFKYLENYEFRLVRTLCRSRNRLIRAYPDNIAEIGFLAALGKSSPFSPTLAAAGALAYWAIGDFKTASPRPLSARAIEEREPVIDTTEIRGGVEYADAYLVDNDARFVFGFVRSALDVGAAAANYVEVVGAERAAGRWRIDLVDRQSGRELTAEASAIVNAAGPFVDGLSADFSVRTDHRIVYSKGVHLIVPRLTRANDRVLAFFDDTRRLFYVIPMGHRSVIGTTDTRTEDPHSVVTHGDRQFLLDQINARLDLAAPLTTADVIAERCGVRPLVVRSDGGDQTDVEWTSLSRRHEIECDRDRSVVTVFGGKLTDCLNVGEEIAEAVESLGVMLEPDHHEWYGEPPLSSRADFHREARLMKLDQLREEPGYEPLTDRLWRRYGRRAFAMIEAIREDPTMGEDILESADYLRVELHHAARAEMVTRLDDFLRRRSKISLVVPEADVVGSPGLHQVCRILFNDRADAELEAYLRTRTPGEDSEP